VFSGVIYGGFWVITLEITQKAPGFLDSKELYFQKFPPLIG